MKILVPVRPMELVKGGLALYCDINNSLYPVTIVSFDEVEYTLEDHEGTRFNRLTEYCAGELFHLRCLE